MPKHLLEFRAHDVVGTNLSGASVSLSVDGAAPRTLSASERAGFEVSPGTEVDVHVAKLGLWPVTGKLKVTASGVENKSTDEKHLLLGMAGKRADGGRHYVVASWLTLFRDAEPDLVNRPRDATGDGPWEIPVPAFTFTCHLFDGPSVLSGKASGGWERFRGHVEENVPSAGEGTTFFLKTPGGTQVPQLVVVFVPRGTKVVSQSPPTLTFIIPKTGHLKTKPYPFHRAYGDVVTKYLVLKVKRVLNQLAGSKKKAILVLPVPHPGRYVGTLGRGTSLRRYLHEVVFHLRVRRGAGPRLSQLGRAAVAGFSAAGTPLAELMKTTVISAQRDDFPELKEIYALDAIQNRVTEMNVAATSWLKDDRKLRIYIAKFKRLEQQVPSFLPGSPVISDEAKEWHSTRGTWLFSPPEFWTHVRDELVGITPATDYFPKAGAVVGHQIHQIIPCLMLSHALATSGF